MEKLRNTLNKVLNLLAGLSMTEMCIRDSHAFHRHCYHGRSMDGALL